MQVNVEIRSVNSVADVMNTVNDAGKSLMQTGRHEVVDFDQVQPGDQCAQRMFHFVARLIERPVGDGMGGELALAQAVAQRARKQWIED